MKNNKATYELSRVSDARGGRQVQIVTAYQAKQLLESLGMNRKAIAETLDASYTVSQTFDFVTLTGC